MRARLNYTTVPHKVPRKMDAVLCRLQSIRQSIEHVTTLSIDQEEKIQIMLFDIYKKLQTREACSEDTMKSLCDEVLFMLSEIESSLYIPVVNHLITRVKWQGKYNEFRVQHEDSVCPAQETEVNEKSKKASKIEICEDESIIGVTDDYWEKRRDRIRSLLGNTSLRFDKNCLKRKKQKSLSWDPCIARTEIELSCEDRQVSQLLRSSEERTQYSQVDKDTFWGLTEDKCRAGKQKKWKSGETICVLNCKSELRKLTEFLQEKKAVRSFYIRRKPKGLAGCKGTWLTPAYSPPLVVKYGCPGKR